MKIVSNAGNPLGLKLLICSKLGGRTVSQETTSLAGNLVVINDLT